ncbi:Cox19 family protein [Perilla frutescens var. hirtella]|nr:Cox19 family protein [Perilla frutescens var. hirtella]
MKSDLQTRDFDGFEKSGERCDPTAGLEEYSSEKSKCQEHFDIYKECRKKEREARLERNRSRSLFS